MPDVPQDPRQLARDILSGKIKIEDLARQRQGQVRPVPPPQNRPPQQVPLPRPVPPPQRPAPQVARPAPPAEPIAVIAGRVCAGPSPPLS